MNRHKTCNTVCPACISVYTLVTVALTSTAAAQASAGTSIGSKPDWMRGRAVNVVISIENAEEMRDFYGRVLGLQPLRDINLQPRVGRPFEALMIQFGVGNSVIKMIVHENLSRPPGDRDTAAGLRVLSIPVTDGEGVSKRIAEWNGNRVSWRQERDYRVAWVRDPGDSEIELRWYDGDAPASDRERLELGITTNDLDAARRYYGKWLGLPELEPVELAGFPGTTVGFRVGESVLRLWPSPKRLPSDTGFTKNGYGLRYVQFIVEDAYALHDHLVSKGAAIAQEPTPLGKTTVLLFAADADGVINECVGRARKAE